MGKGKTTTKKDEQIRPTVRESVDGVVVRCNYAPSTATPDRLLFSFNQLSWWKLWTTVIKCEYSRLIITFSEHLGY